MSSAGKRAYTGAFGVYLVLPVVLSQRTTGKPQLPVGRQWGYRGGLRTDGREEWHRIHAGLILFLNQKDGAD